jgi:hypothetical protein
VIAKSSDIDQSAGSCSQRAWADSWHLWTVIVPRRSISGRLVWGTVWRRSGGRRWAYKKFVEYSDNGDRPKYRYRHSPKIAGFRCGCLLIWAPLLGPLASLGPPSPSAPTSVAPGEVHAGDIESNHYSDVPNSDAPRLDRVQDI